jgi:hypothetical protein
VRSSRLLSHRRGPEERAFLQARVAFFWKVIVFIMLFSSGLGAIGRLPGEASTCC